MQARLALREGAITALASLVQEEMPDTLVGEATQRQLATFVRRLEARKVSLDQYMEATDLDADGLIAQMRAMANEEVRADLALRALADSEGLEVTDAELAAEISRVAAEANRSESEVARQVAEGGGLERLRSDIRNSKAVEWLLDHVEVVDEQGNPMDRALLLEHDGSPDEPRDTTVDESVDSPETADTIAEAADPSDTEESRA